MKKVLSLLLIIFLVIGCTKNEEKDNSNDSVNSNEDLVIKEKKFSFDFELLGDNILEVTDKYIYYLEDDEVIKYDGVNKEKLLNHETLGEDKLIDLISYGDIEYYVTESIYNGDYSYTIYDRTFKMEPRPMITINQLFNVGFVMVGDEPLLKYSTTQIDPETNKSWAEAAIIELDSPAYRYSFGEVDNYDQSTDFFHIQYTADRNDQIFIQAVGKTHSINPHNNFSFTFEENQYLLDIISLSDYYVFTLPDEKSPAASELRRIAFMDRNQEKIELTDYTVFSFTEIAKGDNLSVISTYDDEGKYKVYDLTIVDGKLEMSESKYMTNELEMIESHKNVYTYELVDGKTIITVFK